MNKTKTKTKPTAQDWIDFSRLLRSTYTPPAPAPLPICHICGISVNAKSFIWLMFVLVLVLILILLEISRYVVNVHHC